MTDPVNGFPILPVELQGEPVIFGAGSKTQKRVKTPKTPYEPVIVYLPLRRNETIVPNFDPYFDDTTTLYTATTIEKMVKLNKGLMNEKRVIDSIQCVLLRYLNMDRNGCLCDICWG